MRGPKPCALCLEDSVRQELERYVRRHTTAQQKALRGRIVLLAADGSNNAQIARQLGLHAETARYWRQRWLQEAAVPLADRPLDVRFEDQPRCGAPARITAEAWCQITALACEPPEQSGRPISQWTSRELADEAVKRGLVETISRRHVGRFLKGERPQTASVPLLADTAAGSGPRGEDPSGLCDLPVGTGAGGAGRTHDLDG
jgi:putative transposase